ncbi:MAG: 3-deoxy-8-phosphooctulonate synthase, partial [Deltaproteobacteria bacterium]|nr:3-deoxy-8-phosphooctulonate synthase [Deltaproteobacteria bacterium]
MNMTPHRVQIKDIRIGQDCPLALIAGPCVIEDPILTFDIARDLKSITEKLGIPFIFKASYDKANRTSIHSFRGPGIEEGLTILAHIKSALDIPVISDVHRIQDVEKVSDVLDIIQVPAFLCRQTDFLLE